MSETKTRAPRTIVEEAKNASGAVIARLYSDGTILLKDLRFSYPHVFIAKAQVDKKTGKLGAPKFSIQGLMPKTTHKPAKDLVKKVCDGILAEKKVGRIKDDAKFMKDGDLQAKDECDGMYVISASEQATRPPKVRGPDASPWNATDHAARIYGGCYGNILIRPWWQDNEYGKRINAGLVAVQFVRDGEPFGSGGVSDEEINETFDHEADDSGADPDVDDL